jgi:hypothetical protein
VRMSNGSGQGCKFYNCVQVATPKFQGCENGIGITQNGLDVTYFSDRSRVIFNTQYSRWLYYGSGA